MPGAARVKSLSVFRFLHIRTNKKLSQYMYMSQTSSSSHALACVIAVPKLFPAPSV